LRPRSRTIALTDDPTADLAGLLDQAIARVDTGLAL
jgi:hypothetical protein